MVIFGRRKNNRGADKRSDFRRNFVLYLRPASDDRLFLQATGKQPGSQRTHLLWEVVVGNRQRESNEPWNDKALTWTQSYFWRLIIQWLGREQRSQLTDFSDPLFFWQKISLRKLLFTRLALFINDYLIILCYTLNWSVKTFSYGGKGHLLTTKLYEYMVLCVEDRLSLNYLTATCYLFDSVNIS